MKPVIPPGYIPKSGIMMIIMILLAGSLHALAPARPDTFDITMNSLRFPHELKKYGFKIGTGFFMAKPPMDLLENAIQAPIFNVHMNYGLPWHLSLEGDVSTIIVSNQFALGPRFGYSFRNFSFNIGYDIAFVYGQLKQAGFNNSTKNWINYPNLSLGYKLKKMAFTLKTEGVYVTSVTQVTDGMELSKTSNFYNGFTVGLYVEQRLWKDNVFIFGIKDNYEKYYWPTWMLFTTFNRFYHIPELSFMWIL